VVPWFGAALTAMLAYAGAHTFSAEQWVKPLPALLLGLGVWRAGDRPGARLLAVALIVDSAADAVIEVSFLGGLATFLVGHALRIASFTKDAPGWALARGLPFFAIAAGACALVVPGSGDLGLPIVVYAAAISAMAWRAAARVDGSASAWMGLAGAVLFLASDSLIGVNAFVAPIPYDRLAIMGTYWGAQLLLAASARR
jgi:uncharacterized membrane protein YhhN